MRRFCWLLILGVGLGIPHSAWAHALGAECSLKDGKVQVETFFDDDSPAIGARVQVTDEQDKIVAEGKTDALGLWSFPAPAAGKYVVIVDAGAGHRARTPITVPAGQTAPQPDTSPPINATLSDNPRRAEFTRFPYLKVGLGAAGIFLLSAVFLVARKKCRRPVPNDSVKGA
jgi:nickel transport protein